MLFKKHKENITLSQDLAVILSGFASHSRTTRQTLSSQTAIPASSMLQIKKALHALH